MNKFQRLLWTVNGVLVFIVLSYTCYNFIRERYFWDDYQDIKPPSLVVGPQADSARRIGIALQGLEYGEPISLGKTGKYFLPITVKLYQYPKKIIDQLAESAGDIGPDVGTVKQTVNVAFLDKDLHVKRLLLNKKAFISTFNFPSPQERKYLDSELYFYNNTYFLNENIESIGYVIGYDDSNKDGFLDDEDDADFYISDLDGNNFEQVTSGVSIHRFDFLDKNRVLIQYYSRDTIRSEHKRKYFAKYLIAEKKLEQLDDLDASLDKIDSIVNR